MNNKNKKRRFLPVFFLIFLIAITGCGSSYESMEDVVISSQNTNKEDETVIHSETVPFDFENIPEYSGKPYIEINNNVPYFTESEIVSESFDEYGAIDSLGRCTASIACLSKETMPDENEERGAIGNVKPSGWYSKKYDCVEGKYVMNRCHCIGWQLSGENANEQNLISGSRYLNLEMLEFENMVADYIRETGNHVMYRVTPVFIDGEMLCRGILMEGYSVEDSGKGISYCVYFYNVQPGVAFNYVTGESWYTGEFLDTDSPAVNYEGISLETTDEETENTVSPLPEEGQSVTYVLNRNSLKFHLETCSSVAAMSEKNKEMFDGNREYLISIGYEPCGSCHP